MSRFAGMGSCRGYAGPCTATRGVARRRRAWTVDEPAATANSGLPAVPWQSVARQGGQPLRWAG
jgi:hypothetical protein